MKSIYAVLSDGGDNDAVAVLGWSRYGIDQRKVSHEANHPRCVTHIQLVHMARYLYGVCHRHLLQLRE